MSENTYTAQHETNPHKYFHMLLNMAEDDLDPFEYRLLGHCIRWAGQGGTLPKSTRQLATACKMSANKVRDALQSLKAQGYIQYTTPSEEERRRRVPTAITVLDRWAENIARYQNPPVKPSALNLTQSRKKSASKKKQSAKPAKRSALNITHIRPPSALNLTHSMVLSALNLTRLKERSKEQDSKNDSCGQSPRDAAPETAVPFREMPEPERPGSDGFYAVTHQQAVTLLEAYYNWVPRLPLTAKGETPELGDIIKNRTNLERAKNMWRRGVRPGDVVGALYDFREAVAGQEDSAGYGFIYLAGRIEDYARQEREDGMGHDHRDPRFTPKRPGVPINLGVLGVDDPLLLQLNNPDLFMDVCPRYIEPNDPRQADETVEDEVAQRGPMTFDEMFAALDDDEGTTDEELALLEEMGLSA